MWTYYLELVATFLFLSGNYVSDHSQCLYRLLRNEIRRDQGVLQDEEEQDTLESLPERVQHKMDRLHTSVQRSKRQVIFTKMFYVIYIFICHIPSLSYLVYCNIFIENYTNVEKLTMNIAGVFSVLSETMFVYLDINSSVQHLLEIIIALPNVKEVRVLIRRAFIFQMVTLIFLIMVRSFSLYLDIANFQSDDLRQFIVNQMLFGSYIPFVFSCLYPIAFLFIIPECARQHLCTFDKGLQASYDQGHQNSLTSKLVATSGDYGDGDIFLNSIVRNKIMEIQWLYEKLNLIKHSVSSIVYFSNSTAVLFAVCITEYLGQYQDLDHQIMRFVKGVGLSVTIVLFLWPALQLRKCKSTIEKYQRNFIRGVFQQNLMKANYDGREKEFVQAVSTASREEIRILTQYLDSMFEKEQFAFDTKIPVMEIWPYAVAIFLPILFQIIHLSYRKYT